MDDLFTDDLLHSPKGKSLMIDVIAQRPQNVMGFHDFQADSASPNADTDNADTDNANKDLLNSPSAQSTGSRRSSHLQHKKPLFGNLLDDLTAKKLKLVNINEGENEQSNTSPLKSNVPKKLRDIDMDSIETNVFDVQQKKHNGFELNAKEESMFSCHLQQLSKQVKPLAFTDAETGELMSLKN